MVKELNPEYYEMYLRQDCRCRWCTKTFTFESLTRDHLLPKSKGYPIQLRLVDGKRTIVNCVLACGNCNRLKSDMSLDEFEVFIRQKLEKVPGCRPHYDLILEQILQVKASGVVEQSIELIADFMSAIRRVKHVRKLVPVIGHRFFSCTYKHQSGIKQFVCRFVKQPLIPAGKETLHPKNALFVYDCHMKTKRWINCKRISCIKLKNQILYNHTHENFNTTGINNVPVNIGIHSTT